MSQISEKIQRIIDLRAQHLPGIQKQKKFLQDLLAQIDKLDGLVGVINNEIAQEQGPYYNMIAEDGKIEQAFRRAKDTAAVRSLVMAQLKKITDIENRFKRPSIRVAFFGEERQGKSTFLKTLTGLTDKVIPAYDGDSCTGAVSVIHHGEGPTRVVVEYYGFEDFLEVVRGKIKDFYEGNTVSVNQLSDLQHLPALQKSAASSKFIKFQEAYIDHFNDYKDLIGKGVVTYTDEDEIAKHVSQYEEFSHEVPGSELRPKRENTDSDVYVLKYYKYVAVKHVDIYTPYYVPNMEQLEMVDTIGIGSAADNKDVEKEMYRVLREDCDAAIDLYRPERIPHHPGLQDDIINGIWNHLKNRNPAKWIVYVLNRIPAGKFYNESTVIEVLPKIIKNLQLKGKECPFATIGDKYGVQDINGGDLQEVTDKLMNPLLDLITKNLPELDSNLMSDARASGEELFNAYASLVNNVEGVLKNSMKHSGNATRMFRQLYKVLRQEFDTALTTLNEKYKKKYLEPCPEVADVLGSVIDDLYEKIPETEEIDTLVAQGKNLYTVYSIFADKFCNNIFTAFENVSTDVIIPLRENVKGDVINVLFNEGKMGKIRLTGYDVKNGPSVEWLECLVNEHISKDVYPYLYDVLRFILDYHFNIEDAIEADVAVSIGSIDSLNYRDFIPLPHYVPSPDETAGDFVFQELANRVPQIQSSLRIFKDRFALMPSHSFGTRVNKFHTKVIRDEDTLGNLEEFYIDNEGSIWREEFQNQVDAETAFGQWNEVSEALAGFVHKELFIL